ncbi:hypothetical protein SVIO_091550 [Streptomyces violaceusniger]|uniref:Uncharacterized protein n=1 Tax=Streptomyces violaceusniger TaxID=68280 RepID=A0A4D4LBA3_STRVO|nr:hypothetical protein SVIO_091550 [Streptomyces violaceusniger]
MIQDGTTATATTAPAATPISPTAVDHVRPGRHPAANAHSAVGTTHHRLTTLNPAAATVAASGRCPAQDAHGRSPDPVVRVCVVMSPT